GLLGEIAAGQTVPEFERQVFVLEEGLAAAPIETRYGYHLVYVEKKQPGEAMTLAMCMDKIRQYLTARRHRQAVSDYLHEQVEDADISGVKLYIEQDNIFMG
ncbi:MAG: peptidylprolyl isomerase, partial [Gammaproteobacteria bacterium]